MHDFAINGFDTNVKWSLAFEDGVYKVLIEAPRRKQSPLEMDWTDEDGVETDRLYNKYESKQMVLPVFITADSERALLTKYNSFVQDVILSGADIVLDVEFLNRRFTLRYIDVSDTFWSEEVVTFNLVVMDDYPGTIESLI